MISEHIDIIRRTLIGGLLAASVTIGAGGTANAQDTASPVASPVGGIVERTVDILTVDGTFVATATLTDDGSSVTVDVENSGESGLAPGDHGIHIHQTGACSSADDEAFSGAGDHFNPGGSAHGGPGSPEHHAGDLGNLTVNEDGSIHFEITTTDVTLSPDDENSLDDADGSAIVIHEAADDLVTDPSGESHGRVGCGEIFPDADGTPEASPVASPVG